MKIDELLAVIDRLIDAKIKSFMPSNDTIKVIVKEEISKYINGTIKENDKLIVKENIEYTHPPTITSNKKVPKNVPVVGNSVIDNIFSDIATSGNFIKPEGSMISMKDMYNDNIDNDNDYRTLDGNALLSNKLSQSSMDQTKHQFEQMGANSEITNLMIKDYSKVLKKAEEFSKKSRG